MKEMTYCVAKCNKTGCPRHAENIKKWMFTVRLTDFSDICKKKR